MKKVLVVTFLAGMLLTVAQPVLAGMNPYANFALDMQARVVKRACPISYSSCSVINQVRTNPPPADAIVVVYRYQGITLAQFGLEWDAYQLAWVTFKKCTATAVEAGDPLYGSYAFAGAWETCQMAVSPYPGDSGIAVGWAQINLYGTAVGSSAVDFIGTIPGFALGTGDCNYQWDDIHTVHAGFIGGMQPRPSDLAPCLMGPTATEATTWSGVKALYR